MASFDASPIEQLPDQSIIQSQLRTVSTPAILVTPQRVQLSRSSKTRARLSWDNNLSLYYDADLDFELSPNNGYTPTSRDEVDYPDSLNLDRHQPRCIQNSGFLLTLPLDVRSMIYDLVFDDSPNYLDFELDSHDLDKKKPFRKEGRPTNATSLLRVCRQISTEARDVYYGNTRFHFMHHNHGADYTPEKGLKPRDKLFRKPGDMRKVDYSFLPYLPLRKVSLDYQRYLNLSLITFFVEKYPGLQELRLSMWDWGTFFVHKQGVELGSVQYTAREFADSEDVRQELWGDVLNSKNDREDAANKHLGYEQRSHDRMYTAARYYLRKWEREGREKKPRIILTGSMPTTWCRESQLSSTKP
jgi:hypothetical protein